MFEPDNKRRAEERSLLDFASEATPAKVRQPAGKARRQVPGSLIERLNELAPEREPTARPKPAADPDRSSPISNEADPTINAAKPGLIKRLTQGSWEPLSATRAPRETAVNPDRPLIDISLIAGSVWRLRYAVLATTVLGAVGGVMLALSTPPTFVAESKLYIDPREVRLTDSDLSKESFSTEAILALIETYTSIVLELDENTINGLRHPLP